MPKSIPSTLPSWSHLILISTLRESRYHYFQFSGKETEAQRVTLMCPRSHSFKWQNYIFQLDLTLLKSPKSHCAGHVTSPLFPWQQVTLTTLLQDQLDGNVELGEWDSMLESQMFKQARKKWDDWLSTWILIFSTFHFHLIRLILGRKNDSTQCLLLILQKWPLLCVTI